MPTSLHAFSQSNLWRAQTTVICDVLIARSGLQLLLREGYLASGDVTVQDEATGCVVQLLDPRPGERVLDACAAPGGKALYAAQRMKGQVRGRRWLIESML